jgi:hypothetical protein
VQAGGIKPILAKLAAMSAQSVSSKKTPWPHRVMPVTTHAVQECTTHPVVVLDLVTAIHARRANSRPLVLVNCALLAPPVISPASVVLTNVTHVMVSMSGRMNQVPILANPPQFAQKQNTKSKPQLK